MRNVDRSRGTDLRHLGAKMSVLTKGATIAVTGRRKIAGEREEV